MNRVEPNRNVYVGHRYVPLLVGEWDKTIQYEGLSIVTYQGASYTSKKMTPAGIDIKNEEFWVLTGNYDAQVEYYRLETERVSDDLAQAKIDLNQRMDETVQYVNTNVENLTIYVNDEVQQTKEYVDDSVNEAKNHVDDNIFNITGYGVFSTGERFFGDLRVSARPTPDETINVYPGEAMLPSGKIFKMESPQVIDVTEAVSERFDIVYISESLELKHLEGEENGDVPETPEGGLLLAEIKRDTRFIYGRQVFDKRKMIVKNSDIVTRLEAFKSFDNDDSAISNMLNTALTYIDRDDFYYGNTSTLFNDYTVKNEDGKYSIDCSSFVQAAIQGITFDNSKYNGHYTNYKKDDSLIFPESEMSPFDNRMLANDMANYANKNGWLYNIEQDFSNVRIGDIIFLRNSPQAHFYQGIGHVQIVADKRMDGTILIYESYIGASPNNVINRRTYTKNELIERGALYGARFPLGNGANNGLNVLNYEGQETSSTSSYNLKTYELIEPLKNNQTYTMFIKVDFNDENSYPWLRSFDEDNIYSFTRDVVKHPSGWYQSTFTINENISPVESVRLSNTNPDSGKIGGTVYEFYIFKGYVSSINDFVYPPYLKKVPNDGV